MKKTALITGISGQDGAYLANFLLKKIIKLLVATGDLREMISGDSNFLRLKIKLFLKIWI